MPLPYDLCARVQNAFRARHHKIAVDHTIQNLGILSILLRTGFISNVTRGTIESSSPTHFLHVGEAQRRIWAELKYRDDRPVLTDMELISRPSRRIFMDVGELRRICSGRRAQTIKPLGMGEIAVVRTKSKEHEWLEAREALQLNLEGEESWLVPSS
ncbi:ribosomal protein S8 [Rhizopogon salebrosus TDB-379]|nr:ribosomal protein S8 [Rhizopogon salebrosus TDB-379]